MRWYQPGGDYSRDYWLIDDSDQIIARVRHNFEGTWAFGVREFLSEEGAKKAAMRANGATLKEILEVFPPEAAQMPVGVWLPWSGGNQIPDVPPDHRVAIRYRGGEEGELSYEGVPLMRWTHTETTGDIVAYKINP
jgi:hypothetical protein